MAQIKKLKTTKDKIEHYARVSNGKDIKIREKVFAKLQRQLLTGNYDNVQLNKRGDILVTSEIICLYSRPAKNSN